LRVTTQAYVLRRVRWSESSLILTLYSLDLGRISVMARGALRTEVTLSRREGREIDTLTEASVVRGNDGLRADPLVFAHACLLAEWVLGLVYGTEPSQPVFHLLDRSVAMLAAGEAQGWPVVCAGVERLLRLSGFGMETDRCVSCGRPAGGRPGWRPESGGVVCEACGGGAKVPAGFLSWVRRSRESGLPEMARIRLWPGGFRQCHDIMRSFAEAQLGSALKLRSLAVVEDLENG
jgi:DNA repair protein RecO (recombination protein O)